MQFNIIIFLIMCLISKLSFSDTSIEQICSNTEEDIKKIEKSKNNLKKEFKQIKSETEKMEMLDEITNDVNKLIDQQIRFSKLYHYLECSRYAKKKNRN